MREQREILERHADAAMLGATSVMSSPSISDRARRRARSTPAMSRSSTVLPVPDGPNITTISPSATVERQVVEDLSGT